MKVKSQCNKNTKYKYLLRNTQNKSKLFSNHKGKQQEKNNEKNQKTARKQ